MSYRIIQNLLDTQLETVANLPPLTKENESSALTSDASESSRVGARYTRSTLLPIETVPLSIGVTGFDTFAGLYQVDIFTPFEDGVNGPNFICDAIIAAFPAATQLIGSGITLRIMSYWRETAQQSTNYYMLPVVIRWDAYIQR